jgi:hypothetical protein
MLTPFTLFFRSGLGMLSPDFGFGRLSFGPFPPGRIPPFLPPLRAAAIPAAPSRAAPTAVAGPLALSRTELPPEERDEPEEVALGFADDLAFDELGFDGLRALLELLEDFDLLVLFGLLELPDRLDADLALPLAFERLLELPVLFVDFFRVLPPLELELELLGLVFVWAMV